MIKSCLTSISFYFALFFCIFDAAHAVMPPKVYDSQARQSKIKAVAVVKKIFILSETKEKTHKKIVFEIEKGFEKSTPQTFSGTCDSVDHAWQSPLLGGTIYYYPTIGQKVLVTISNNGGFITSFTPFNAALEQEIEENQLLNISFEMGTAHIKKTDRKWFIFSIKNEALGYLMLNTIKDGNTLGIFQFEQELLIGELDKDRSLFHMNTQFRENDTFTPEWIEIKRTDYTDTGTIPHPKKKYGFTIKKALGVQSGILLKSNSLEHGILIPERTCTDFLMFRLIEKRPFTKDDLTKINLIETLELHLKKDIGIQYLGRDKTKNDLHKFSQTGSARATYWVDNNHKLVEVMWDEDKRFVRSNESEAMTILQ